MRKRYKVDWLNVAVWVLFPLTFWFIVWKWVMHD